MQGNPPTEAITKKAVDHYRDRQRQQKSPFAQYGEQNPIMQVGQDSKALEEQYLGQPKETQQMNDLQDVVNIQKREGAAEKLRLLSDKAFDAGNIETLSSPKKIAGDAIRQGLRMGAGAVGMPPVTVPKTQRERYAEKPIAEALPAEYKLRS